MDKYLIITDLDGTLLNSQHSISDFNLQQIERYQQQGGLFTIATGRINRSVEQYIKKLNLTIPIITYNGAQIYDPVDKKILYQKSFKVTDRLIEQLKILSFHAIEILFFNRDNIFVINRGEVCRDFEQKEGLKVKEIDWGSVPVKVNKMMFMSKSRPLLQDAASRLKENFGTIELVFSQIEYLEILPKQTSKGEALRELIKRCNLENKYTIGFGDNYNDLSLLANCHMGIAVNNAEPDLKKIADNISKHSNDQDAVGRYLATLFK